MQITDYRLAKGEFYEEIVEKDTLFIHHTAGGHRPDWTIDGWAKDRNKSGGQLAVATAYVIGGIATRDKSVLFDGKIYRAFDDKFWAHHLGLKTATNTPQNKSSIGIEICSYGPLTKTKEGTFLNYVNSSVPFDMVEELPTPFRGYSYYQKYTTRQLDSLKYLISDICKRHPKINPQRGLKQFMSMELNNDAVAGAPGIWSHSSVRGDKFDVFPQPQLLELIKTF